MGKRKQARRLFTDKKDIDYHCNCSKERVRKVLKSVGYNINKDNFKNIDLYYYSGEVEYKEASDELKAKYYDFNTYPYKPTPPYGSPVILYYRELEWKFNPIDNDSINTYLERNE